MILNKQVCYLLPFATKSVNNKLRMGKGRVFLDSKVRKMKEDILKYMEKYYPNTTEISKILTELKYSKLETEILIYDNWINEKHKYILRKDLDNRLKFIIDTIFEYIDIDDKNIFRLISEKRDLNESINEKSIKITVGLIE